MTFEANAKAAAPPVDLLDMGDSKPTPAKPAEQAGVFNIVVLASMLMLGVGLWKHYSPLLVATSLDMEPHTTCCIECCG